MDAGLPGLLSARLGERFVVVCMIRSALFDEETFNDKPNPFLRHHLRGAYA